jgi:hypothetical protein
VTGVERDAQGDVAAFFINDSGDGNAAKRVPVGTFQSALNGLNGGVMAVSKDPVFPAVTNPKRNYIDWNDRSNPNRYV